MNKPILCCLRIKPATLLVGLVDLAVHMFLLATIFASYSHLAIFDQHYANSMSLISSSSSSCMSASMVSGGQFRSTLDVSSPIDFNIQVESKDDLKDFMSSQLTKNYQNVLLSYNARQDLLLNNSQQNTLKSKCMHLYILGLLGVCVAYEHVKNRIQIQRVYHNVIKNSNFKKL